MTPDGVAHIVGQMFVAAFWISAPLLAIGFVTGIVISLIQVLTSIQDSGFNAIPASDCVSGREPADDAVDGSQGDVVHDRHPGNLSRYGR